MEGNNVNGRGITAGYWTGCAYADGVHIMMGCGENPEFWARVMISEDLLREMLRQVDEAKAAETREQCEGAA
jgi:hypothetical protein